MKSKLAFSVAADVVDLRQQLVTGARGVQRRLTGQSRKRQIEIEGLNVRAFQTADASASTLGRVGGRAGGAQSGRGYNFSENIPSVRPVQQQQHKHQEPTSTFQQSLFNSVNILLGVGLLSVPYALKEGGWSALGVLGLLGFVTNYTGKALIRCQESVCRPKPGPPLTPEERVKFLGSSSPEESRRQPLETYEDIGELAFGPKGRAFISAVLYIELIGTCGLFFILTGDHMSQLFDGAHSPEWYMIAAAAVMLPSTWLSDLSALSYVGLLGAGATLCLTGVVGYDFLTADHMAGIEATHLANLETLPVTFGLLAFVFAGHAVFPSIYSSMEEPERYDDMLNVTYGVVGTVCVLMGAAGYVLFGDAVNEEITLNLPVGLMSTVALGAVVVNPFAKFALTLDPVAKGVDRALGFDILGDTAFQARAVRTGLGLGALSLATSVPDFAVVMSLIGSFLTLTVSVIFPSLCYLEVFDEYLSDAEKYLNRAIVLLGVFCAVSGTASALEGVGS